MEGESGEGVDRESEDEGIVVGGGRGGGKVEEVNGGGGWWERKVGGGEGGKEEGGLETDGRGERDESGRRGRKKASRMEVKERTNTVSKRFM